MCKSLTELGKTIINIASEILVIIRISHGRAGLGPPLKEIGAAGVLGHKNISVCFG